MSIRSFAGRFPLLTSSIYSSPAFGPALHLSAHAQAPGRIVRGWAAGGCFPLPLWCSRDDETQGMLIRLAALVHGEEELLRSEVG